jgi:hypothetical protein
MGLDFRHYEPPGPVGAAFIKSRGPIDLIMGPGGSGKTVASVIKGPRHAASYAPVGRDGWVRVKTLCVRDTYRSFAATALQSWYELFPEKHPWTYTHEGGQDRPVKHVLRWQARRGSDLVNIEYTMETGAIGDNNLEAFFKGYEVTYGWMNECDILHEKVPGLLFQRTGRFPPVQDLAPSEVERVSRQGRASMEIMGLKVDPDEVVLPRIVWGDYNPPDLDNWAVRIPIEEKRPGFNHFWQPGGLDPQAENRKGKPRSSYELELATTSDEQLARRMIHGQPGYAIDGKPVYPEFNLLRHRADERLTPQRAWPLHLGIDGGGSPAAVIVQFAPDGQLLIHDEICAEPGTGPSRFSEMLVELLIARYPGFAIRSVWGDPANFYSPDTQAGELSFMMIIQQALGVPVYPAPSNEPALRQEAVRWYLGRPIDGNKERLTIDPACRILIGGFASHYKLTKQATASGTDKLAVAKNKYSHPHDALQYVCLGHRGSAGVMSDAAQMGRAGNVVSMQRRKATPASRTDFDVWNV